MVHIGTQRPEDDGHTDDFRLDGKLDLQGRPYRCNSRDPVCRLMRW